MIARPPSVKCPSCPAEAGRWCHDEEHRICALRAAVAALRAKGTK